MHKEQASAWAKLGMMGWLVGLSLLAALVAAVIATGWWRVALGPFRIPPARMTVARLGLEVTSATDVDRVDGVLRSFAGGFNRMLTGPSSDSWRQYCDSLEAVYQPFAQEGAAMGFVPRRLFRFDPAEFEERIVRTCPQFRYLHYVGLGFWSGMRNHAPARMARLFVPLDAMYQYLCYDGYGFKQAFFDPARQPESLAPLEELSGYARNAAFQGVGRAVYFLFMSRPDRMIAYAEQLGPYAADVAGGLGLASVFVHPDNLQRARDLGAALPTEWHRDFHQGMCFGLKARSINDTERFAHHLAGLEQGVQEAAWAAIRECDRIELQIRADGQPDGYRRWRAQVAAWMAEHIEYPLGGLKRRSAAEASVTEPAHH